MPNVVANSECGYAFHLTFCHFANKNCYAQIISGYVPEKYNIFHWNNYAKSWNIIWKLSWHFEHWTAYFDCHIAQFEPYKHLRWSSLWWKIDNGWKLLLTVVTELHLKGILQQKLSIFWNERLGISEMKQLKNFFFLFPMAYIFYFCKNMNPLSFHFIFGW